jgi:hypothetical protein
MTNADEFVVVQMWSDEEIGGRIYLQMCNLFAQAVLKEEHGAFMEHAMSVMQKLTATKYHLANYQRLEVEEKAIAEGLYKRGSANRREAFPLIFELEAFLFQVKSSLDMLAKLLGPTIGHGNVKTSTYGAKGDGLIKGLEAYRKRPSAHRDAVDNLIQLVALNKDSWIGRVVDWRDTVSHYRALTHFRFEFIQGPDGNPTCVPPRFEGMDTLPFLRLVYSNNVQYQQDFMAFALALKARGLSLIRANVDNDPNPSWRYVKWGWGQRV